MLLPDKMLGILAQGFPLSGGPSILTVSHWPQDIHDLERNCFGSAHIGLCQPSSNIMTV